MTIEKIVVVGFGSLNGDDQAGWLVIDSLQNKVSEKFTLFKSKADGVDWFPIVEGATKVFFVDAVKSGSKVGFIHNIKDQKSFQNKFSSTSHAINIFESIELAKALGYLKTEFQFFAIEIKSEIKDEHRVTEEVSQSIVNVANHIGSLI